MTDPIVIAFPTIMNGLVLRWYRTESAAEDGKEFMSVSRDGAEIYCSASEVPPQAAADAANALGLFRLNRDDEVKQMATHRFKRFMSREIEPVEQAETPS